MADLLSALPPELLLMVLCDLSDLKALYAAVLASPRLWRVFRTNARHVFWAVAHRTMPDFLIGPMAFYMRLQSTRYRGKYARYDDALSHLIENDPDEGKSVFMGQLLPSQDLLVDKKVLHLIAQAVRVHDMADFVVRTKLNYLASLWYREKVDHLKSTHWSINLWAKNPGPLPAPSWYEENRAVRAMWMLATACRLSNMCGYFDEVELDDLLGYFHDEVTLCSTVEELKEALEVWPTLCEPLSVFSTPQNYTLMIGDEFESSGRYARDTHLILECYPAPSFHYNLGNRDGAVARLGPVLPQFARVPAKMPKSAPADTEWAEDEWALCRNGDWPLLHSISRRLSVLWGVDTDHVMGVLERLGFDLWDRRRMNSGVPFLACSRIFRIRGEDFEIRSSVLTGSAATPARDDEFVHMCRLYEQEEHRDAENWTRSLVSQALNTIDTMIIWINNTTPRLSHRASLKLEREADAL